VAAALLQRNHITAKPVSTEVDVKSVLATLTEGEADAGIVYVTDVLAAGDKAQAVDIPENINVVANYPIASINASKSPDVDKAFINFVLGDDGQAILKEYGFLPPPS
jgi:molybdate transport system substrate-binding protein